MKETLPLNVEAQKLSVFRMQTGKRGAKEREREIFKFHRYSLNQL